MQRYLNRYPNDNADAKTSLLSHSTVHAIKFAVDFISLLIAFFHHSSIIFIHQTQTLQFRRDNPFKLGSVNTSYLCEAI